MGADRRNHGEELFLGEVPLHLVDGDVDPLEVADGVGAPLGDRYAMVKAGIDAGRQRKTAVNASTPVDVQHVAEDIGVRRDPKNVVRNDLEPTRLTGGNVADTWDYAAPFAQASVSTAFPDPGYSQSMLLPTGVAEFPSFSPGVGAPVERAESSPLSLLLSFAVCIAEDVEVLIAVGESRQSGLRAVVAAAFGLLRYSMLAAFVCMVAASGPAFQSGGAAVDAEAILATLLAKDVATMSHEPSPIEVDAIVPYGGSGYNPELNIKGI